jgi:dTDP-4-amino-4,6-dideoxygalactose transaminase
MKIPFFDLQKQTELIRDELQVALMDVVDSQRFILGPPVERVETAVAEKLGVRHAIGVGSGSDALLLSLMAAGIEPGEEVIVPAYSFFSTASSALRLGLRIVFADVDPRTLQIDPGEVRRRTTPRTRAVIAAHLFGDCADVRALKSLAADSDLVLIEDAAQAFGAMCWERPAGTMGFCGCLSFYPTKNLAAIGDAGMVITNDAGAAKRLRLMRAHGLENQYEHNILGINSRMDSIQAAALSVRLKYVDDWNERRRQIAHRYDEELRDLVEIPLPATSNRAVYHQYVIRTQNRDQLRTFLAAEGVATAIYYPIPLHLQPGLAPFCGSEGDYPNAEEAARTSLALPIYPELQQNEVDYVIEKIRAFRA